MSTPYLDLDLPVVTSTLGPEWAQLLNDALLLVDDHDHTSGKGRPITSAALNINDDVSLNNFNFTAARSFNMTDQVTPISGARDVRSVYAAGGELYYNDSAGNQVRITLNGAIDASSSGGISGMTGGASVAYNSVSKTFTFSQSTGKNAKLDVADILIREAATSANAITLKSPTSLASAYTVTLPTAVPASTLAVQMSSTGVLTADTIKTAQIDPAGLGSAAYAAGSIGTTALADSSVTASKIANSAGAVKLVTDTFNGAAGVYSWICPANVSRVLIKAVGGGGGGGGGGASFGGTNEHGGGGGAGAQVRASIVSVTPTSIKTFAPSDVNISTEIITVTAHGYSEQQSIVFSSTGGLPGGLTAGVVYYTKTVTTNSFKVAATIGGSAINLTTQGTGVHTVQTTYAVTLGAGGTGGGSTVNGGAGSLSSFGTGVALVAYFNGGAGGQAGALGSASGGTGGSNFTWSNLSTPGGNNGLAGSDSPDGTVGGAAGNAALQSGGGGGGSIGAGGAGSVGAGSGIGGNASPGTFGSGGGGAGGGNLGGGTGGTGGSGYLEVNSWQNVNP